jgi:DNA-binding transcriptional LysR family regulator
MPQEQAMTNIPTELLRTLVAVVDLRSFTKAAHSLGITQPAVSAQIKRLQTLLGGELFDKSAPGVALTEKGVRVVNYARRLLTINDQIFGLTTRGDLPDRIRLGIPIDYFPRPVFDLVHEFRKNESRFQLQIETDHSENLLRDLRHGDYDLVLALTDTAQMVHARFSWVEELAWGGASEEMFEPQGPVSIIGFSENSLSRRLSVAALEQAKQPYEIVAVVRSFDGMQSAARAGLGVVVFSKRILSASGLAVCNRSSKLPRVPDLLTGIYVRNDVGHVAIDNLADAIAAAIRPPDVAAQPSARQAAAR